MVTSVQEDNAGSENSLALQSEPWIGAINLDEAHVKIIRSLFEFTQCHTNNHTFPSCPFLKKWVIKKKVRTDSMQETSTSGALSSAIASTTESYVEGAASSSSNALDTVHESLDEDEFDSNVDFDLLQDNDDNQDTDASDEVYPCSDIKVPLASVKSVSSYITDFTMSMSSHNDFNVIIDSGCM